MPFQDIAPATTGNTLNAQDSGKNFRTLWNSGAEIGEEEEDFLQQFEGPSERFPVWAENDTSKGAGSKKVFTTTSGYYREGKYGEGLFDTTAEFEEDDISSYEVRCDFIRNAASRSIRSDEFMGIKGELKSMVPLKLGRWLGRTKKDQIMGLAVHKLPNENRLFSNSKTLATLGTADVLDWDDIVTAGAAMKPLGGEAFRVSKDGRNMISSQLFIPPEQAATSLRLDTNYINLLGNAGERGGQNNLFKGGYPDIDGHTIAPHNALNHAGKGPVGSFLAPEAYLGLAFPAPANNNARVITGGGSDNTAGLVGINKPLWFKFFAGHAFQFIDTGAIAQNVGPHFAIIYNTSGVNVGKWGMIEYTTGNDGNAITVVRHLADNGALATGGARAPSVGSVTWNPALNTEVWASGALIIPCNVKGVPFAHTMVLGAGAIVRCYGSMRNQRDEESINGNFVKRTFITSVFGQSLRTDRKGRVPAAMLLTTAIKRPGINLPIIA
jgi:hypothetical protein